MPSGSLDPAGRAFWCALGNLYAAARTDLMRLGHAAVLRPDVAESPMLQNVSPSPARLPTRLWHALYQALSFVLHACLTVYLWQQTSFPQGDLPLQH